MKDCYYEKEEEDDECSSIVTSTRIYNPPSLFFCIHLFYSFFFHCNGIFFFQTRKNKIPQLLNAIARWRHSQLSTLRRRPSPPAPVVFVSNQRRPHVQSRLWVAYVHTTHTFTGTSYVHTHNGSRALNSSTQLEIGFFLFVSSARESTVCVCVSVCSE